MALVRLVKFRTSPPQFATVDTDATVGARIGVDLLMPDGTIATTAKLAALFGTGATPSGALNTTDDLQEGQWNLWFTPLRAQDAVGGILADSANVTLRYVDGTSITADLTELPDAGGGALLRFVRDAWGRITGTSTPTTADLAEGSNLYYTDARADARIPPGYIDGLQMQWVSGTALTVTSGAAYIQGSAKVLRAPSAIAKTGLALTASTWYHVYLYSNAGTPDVEIVTTAPAAAYNGTARSKTGDTSRRYVGSVLSTAASALAQFVQSGDYIGYLGNLNVSPYFTVVGGQATARTTIDFSGVLPVTSALANACAQNTDTAVSVYLGPSSLATVNNTSYQFRVAQNSLSVIPGAFNLGADRTIDYVYQTTPTGKFFCIVCGYWYGR